jgi:hypothetical protein
VAILALKIKSWLLLALKEISRRSLTNRSKLAKLIKRQKLASETNRANESARTWTTEEFESQDITCQKNCILEILYISRDKNKKRGARFQDLF